MPSTPTPVLPLGHLSYVVEKLQLAGYTGFWIMVLTGISLTKVFGHVDMDHTVLMQVFGYNNICVYFDYAPSTYVLPGVWAVTLVFLLAYMVGHVLQLRAEVLEGLLPLRTYRLLFKMKLFEAFTMVMFSTIFAVTPEGWDHTLYIHTAPFFLLQLGLVSLALSNTIHGIGANYWGRLGLPGWMVPAAKVYIALFAAIVCFKILAGTNAMAHSPWWNQSYAFMQVAHTMDKLFLLFAAVVPMAMALWIVVTRSHRLQTVYLTSFMNRMRSRAGARSREQAEN